MDTSRKILTNKDTCYFCIYFQQLTGISGKKICSGRCKVNGRIYTRTNKACKKNFRSKEQIGLFGDNE